MKPQSIRIFIFIAFILLIFTIASKALAQTTPVVGRVVDATSLTPISGLDISVFTSENGSNSFVDKDTTDVNGRFRIFPTITDIRQENNEVPSDYKLSSPYPNPSSGISSVQFSVPIHGNVNLKIYDILGRECISSEYVVGSGIWAADVDLSRLAAGIYFISMFSDNKFIGSSKIILDKSALGKHNYSKTLTKVAGSDFMHLNKPTTNRSIDSLIVSGEDYYPLVLRNLGLLQGDSVDVGDVAMNHVIEYVPVVGRVVDGVYLNPLDSSNVALFTSINGASVRVDSGLSNSDGMFKILSSIIGDSLGTRSIDSMIVSGKNYDPTILRNLGLLQGDSVNVGNINMNGYSGTTIVNGRVVNDLNAGLPGKNVKLFINNDHNGVIVVTGDDGVYSFSVPPPNSLQNIVDSLQISGLSILHKSAVLNRILSGTNVALGNTTVKPAFNINGKIISTIRYDQPDNHVPNVEIIISGYNAFTDAQGLFSMQVPIGDSLRNVDIRNSSIWLRQKKLLINSDMTDLVEDVLTKAEFPDSVMNFLNKISRRDQPYHFRTLIRFKDKPKFYIVADTTQYWDKIITSIITRSIKDTLSSMAKGNKYPEGFLENVIIDVGTSPPPAPTPAHFVIKTGMELGNAAALTTAYLSNDSDTRIIYSETIFGIYPQPDTNQIKRLIMHELASGLVYMPQRSDDLISIFNYGPPFSSANPSPTDRLIYRAIFSRDTGWDMYDTDWLRTKKNPYAFPP